MSSMSKRSYGQNCALAIGLDIIGERWTLLIVRALLIGPKRYSQLAEQLQGMGSNLLAARLKSLAAAGVIEKCGGETGSAGYALTERGEQLRPIVHAMIRWGHQFREDGAGEGGTSRPEWDMLAIEAAFRPGRANGASAVIELTLDGFTFHIVIDQGQARCLEGAADHPDVVAVTSTDTLIALGRKKLALNEAQARGDLQLTGRRKAFELLFTLFSL